MDVTFVTVLLMLLSPAVGSFLGVLVDRLPRGQDVIRNPSSCRECGARLRLRDLVPILSYTSSVGQCRHCGAPIPGWLLYLEILAVGAAVWAVLLGRDPVEMVLIAAILWTLLTLAACDLIWMRLPNPLTLSLLIFALLWVLQSGGALGPSILGAAVGAGVFALIRLGYRAVRGREGLGMGDVKLMAGLGALSGAIALPQVILGAALLALGGVLIDAIRRPDALGATQALPFGAALSASGTVWWLIYLSGYPVLR